MVADEYSQNKNDEKKLKLSMSPFSSGSSLKNSEQMAASTLLLANAYDELH
jgi:hypothetical protein